SEGRYRPRLLEYLAQVFGGARPPDRTGTFRPRATETPSTGRPALDSGVSRKGTGHETQAPPIDRNLRAGRDRGTDRDDGRAGFRRGDRPRGRLPGRQTQRL